MTDPQYSPQQPQQSYGTPQPQQQPYTPPQPQQPYASAQQQAYTPPQQGQQPYGAPQVNVNIAPTISTQQPTYYMTESDRTLRLLAVIFMIINTVSLCWLIIPLAWMIPMTIISWGIYKGTKPNSMVFAICALLFCGILPGIFLLISTKEK